MTLKQHNGPRITTVSHSRDQAVLTEIRAAMEYSRALESALHTQLGCSRYELEALCIREFGPPNERDFYMANKAVHKALISNDQSAPAERRKTFRVSNPI